MEQLSPYVLRTAMMLEELEFESQRAAYMVIADMHRLQQAARAADESPTIHDITKKEPRQQKMKRR